MAKSSHRNHFGPINRFLTAGFAIFLCSAFGISGHARDIGKDLVVQPDGKFVIVGNGAAGEVALVRYYPDGGLDFSFGVEGKVLTRFLIGFYEVRAAALQPDGKIVIAGDTHGDGYTVDFDFAVARYHSDGRLDESFGDGGLVTTDFAGASDVANDVAIQSDGKIVVVGESAASGFLNGFAIARYHPDGRLDGSFGNNGKVIVGTPASNEEAKSLVLQPDGKILVAGNKSDPIILLPLASTESFEGLNSDQVIVLARFDNDGNLDPAFGGDGWVESSPPGMSIAENLRLQPDGKIVVSGHKLAAFGLARYLPDGSPDTGFGEGGFVTDERPDSYTIGGCLGIQPDGKIVLAGSDQSYYSPAVVGWRPPGYDFQLVRFLPDGTPDDSFTEGRIDFFGCFMRPPEIEYSPVAFPKTRTNDVPAAVEVLPNGEILVAGWSDRDFAAAQFEVDGALDPAFGKEGKVVTDLDRYQPDSKIRARGHERIGGSIYQPNGIGQNIRVVNRRGNSAEFRFFVENDGTEVDAITLKASRKRERIRVRYFRLIPRPSARPIPLPPRRENVTARLSTLGLEVLLTPFRGDEEKFEARVRSRKGGTRFTTLEISACSDMDPLKKDAVRALVILGK